MATSQRKPKIQWWKRVLFAPFVPLLVVFLLIALLLLVLWTFCLHVVIWAWWCSRGLDVLFVYSDSPTWHDYIEGNLLPQVQTRAVVLNWSERKRWRFSLARIAFYHFGGTREFNPLAVVFRPFRCTRTFRFWQAFQDFRRGKPDALLRIENEFFQVMGIDRGSSTA